MSRLMVRSFEDAILAFACLADQPLQSGLTKTRQVAQNQRRIIASNLSMPGNQDLYLASLIHLAMATANRKHLQSDQLLDDRPPAGRLFSGSNFGTALLEGDLNRDAKYAMWMTDGG